MENVVISIKEETNNSWSASIGEETLKLKKYFQSKQIDETSISNLISQAKKILEKCGNPKTPSYSDTGLVFGYVQSGKTMSFTTLATLAKDNGFQIIIVIAGVTTNLVSQSTERLEKDLQLNSYHRKWLAIPNPKSNEHKNSITNTLKSWKEPTFPKSKRKTVLITVMKQKNHLLNLIKLLQSINLENVPTLIIDDEGDQASLNTYAKKNSKNTSNNFIFNEEQISTIYRHINNLKLALPHHTFIQYTATPQAPLFIHMMDNLSPNFIELLTPGGNYTGGNTFFGNNFDLIRDIPQEEIGTKDEPLIEPPESLLEAMRIFFLGVVLDFINPKFRYRSMLIHPSHLTIKHEDYFIWAKQIKEGWIQLLSLDDRNIDKQELLEEFKQSYQDLKSTVLNIDSFEELTAEDKLLHSIRETQIRQVNSKNKNKVNWRDFYSHILVGGFKMDRGFTVEGLTVTYMPRSRGVGNADTIQQRARFFGYKKDYIGLCRVFIDNLVRADYEAYAEHEEDMRLRLSEHVKTGKPLNEWYREIFLDRALRLTRPNVIYNHLERSRFGERWFTPKSPHDNYYAIRDNRSILNSFTKSIDFEFDTNVVTQKKVLLKDVIEKFLAGLRFTKIGDSTHYTALIYTLRKHLDEFPDEKCTLFYISSFNQPRERSLNKKREIKQLFQGGNKRTGSIRNIKASSGVSVQIHVLNIKEENGAKEVPTVAIYIPETIGKDLIRWEEQ